MAAEGEMRRMLGKLFETAGLEVTEPDLHILRELHTSFAIQRSRLDGMARPRTEPMTIAAFDRAQLRMEQADESASE